MPAANTWYWQCISDPTERPEQAYLGDFYGGHFRLYDLRVSQEMHIWPEGITFQNIQTGERLACLAGELVEIAA